MTTNDTDAFTYYNNILALKHEMQLITGKLEDVSSQVKKVCMDLDSLSASTPAPQSGKEQKPYLESGNPHSETPLEKIGDGG